MIDGSEKRIRQLAFGLQNSHVCEKRSNFTLKLPNGILFKWYLPNGVLNLVQNEHSPS